MPCPFSPFSEALPLHPKVFAIALPAAVHFAHKSSGHAVAGVRSRRGSKRLLTRVGSTGFPAAPARVLSTYIDFFEANHVSLV
ncbi:MAG: hypothetical protein RIB55_10330 [Nitratireductor sp.]